VRAALAQQTQLSAKQFVPEAGAVTQPQVVHFFVNDLQFSGIGG
jgi:hypothetical protein